MILFFVNPIFESVQKYPALQEDAGLRLSQIPVEERKEIAETSAQKSHLYSEHVQFKDSANKKN